jgi:hypothetical protein
MIDADEEKQLDKSFYSKSIKKADLTITVSIDGRIVKRKALMYTVDTDKPMNLPTPEYLRLCAEAMVKMGAEFTPVFNAYIETRQAIMNKADA